MNTGIYKITNVKNGKFYIGSAKDIERRWWEHKNDLKKKKHINTKLQNAWDFYGEPNFEFIILEVVNESDLFNREQFYLDVFKPYIKDIGYNINPKASGGDNFTFNPNKTEILKNMTIANNVGHMHGKKHSDETKEKQKERAVGRYTLEWFIQKYGNDVGLTKYKERNEKLSNRNINYSYDNGLKGKKHGVMSDEMKHRISEKKRNFALRKNEFIDDLKSGKFTISQLSEKYDVSMTTIKSYKRKF